MKTARMTNASHDSLLLSPQGYAIIRESAEAVTSLVRVVLLGVLLLAVVRVVFELTGSHASSVSETVRALSQWLLVPFRQFSDLGAAVAATVSLSLIMVIGASLTNQTVKESA